MPSSLLLPCIIRRQERHSSVRSFLPLFRLQKYCGKYEDVTCLVWLSSLPVTQRRRTKIIIFPSNIIPLRRHTESHSLVKG